MELEAIAAELTAAIVLRRAMQAAKEGRFSRNRADALTSPLFFSFLEVSQRL